MKRLWVLLILVLAFAGLADSLYIAQSESTGTPLICNIQNLSGCNVVANSSYSIIFGVPVAQWGVLYYGALFVLAALELVVVNRLLRRAVQVFAGIGLIVSLYSTFVQIFFIKALCIYCLASALITVFIFILARFVEPLWPRRPLVPMAATATSSKEALPMPPV